MTWSGKDALYQRFQRRFHDQRRLQESINRYITSAYALDDQRADEWVERDLAKDEALADITDAEDYAVGPSRYAATGCYHCFGVGYVSLFTSVEERANASISDPRFGRGKPCPACSGVAHPEDHCAKCRAFASGSLDDARVAQDEDPTCWRCGQLESSPAGERCTHRRWHLPHQTEPESTAPPGWKRPFS